MIKTVGPVPRPLQAPAQTQTGLSPRSRPHRYSPSEGPRACAWMRGLGFPEADSRPLLFRFELHRVDPRSAFPVTDSPLPFWEVPGQPPDTARGGACEGPGSAPSLGRQLRWVWPPPSGILSPGNPAEAARLPRLLDPRCSEFRFLQSSLRSTPLTSPTSSPTASKPHWPLSPCLLFIC